MTELPKVELRNVRRGSGIPYVFADARSIGELFEGQECEMSLQDPAGCKVS